MVVPTPKPMETVPLRMKFPWTFYFENVLCFLLGPELVYIAFRSAKLEAVKDMVALRRHGEGLTCINENWVKEAGTMFEKYLEVKSIECIHWLVGRGVKDRGKSISQFSNFQLFNFSDEVDDGATYEDCRWRSRFVGKDATFTFTCVDLEVSRSAEYMKINGQD